MQSNRGGAHFASVAVRVPPAHSILAADALAAIASSHWSIEPIQRASLIQHGQNDWYCLEGSHSRYALRVLKTGARDATSLAQELAWTRALAAAGLRCVGALPTRTGAEGIELAAPEGERLSCLYPWLAGRTLDTDLTAAQSRAAGELLAQIHRATPQLTTSARRHSLTEKLAGTAARLDEHLTDNAERAIVAAARDYIAPVLARESSLPQGSLHGDLHFGNLRVDDDQRLHALDFDDCGRGALCADLTPFLWRNRNEGLPIDLDLEFVNGYAAIRSLTADEVAALPALLAARALYIASVFIRDRNKLGRVPGFDKPWPHYLALIDQILRSDRAQYVRG